MIEKRNETAVKARRKHARKHRRRRCGKSGLVEQVQGLVATAVQAVGHAATVAGNKVKDAVTSPESSRPK